MKLSLIPLTAALVISIILPEEKRLAIGKAVLSPLEWCARELDLRHRESMNATYPGYTPINSLKE